MTSIGQALLERSAINAKIVDILARVQNNALISVKSDGTFDQPCEDSVELLKKVEILENRHAAISSAIINANYSTKTIFENREYKIIDIIEMIDNITKKVKRIKDIIESCESSVNKKKNYGYDEDKDKKKCVINLAELRDKIDAYCSTKNKLHVVLQELNWSTKINY
jgi:hypothetical protein